MLAALAAVGDDQVRVHVSREVGRACAGTTQYAVDKDTFAITRGLEYYRI